MVLKVHNRIHDCKGHANKIYTVVKGSDALYRRHTVPLQAIGSKMYEGRSFNSGTNEPPYHMAVRYSWKLR